MCGDSTDKEQVDRLMDGCKADMVFTDPPYGMNLDTSYDNMKGRGPLHKTGGNSYDNVKGDHDDFDSKFITTIIEEFHYCKEIFLWGFDYYAELIPNRKSGSVIVWDKRTSESQDEGFGSCFELCWSKNRHKRYLARILWAGVFGFNEDTKKRLHPTQKPVQLAEWFFDKWGKDKNLIVDLFLGSGSTLIACEKTNRQCFGMELDEHYCSVIIQRYIDFVGGSSKVLLTSNDGDKTLEEVFKMRDKKGI